MQIWVDADACPGTIKELLFRAANRTKTKLTLVANQPMRTPSSEFIDNLLVPAGMNVAMMHSDQPEVAFIGDSIFFYSGMTGLANAGVSSNRRR